MITINLLRKLADQQQYAELKDTCLGFLQEDPNPAILPLLAVAYVHLGQLTLAHETLAQINECQAEYDAASLVDLSAVYIVLHRFDEAESLLQQALTIKPDHGLGLARLGLCLLAKGDLQGAQISFEKAADIEPERIPIFTHLLQIYLQLKKSELAQVLVERAFASLAKIKSTIPESLAEYYWQTLCVMQLQVWVASEQFAEAEEWLHEQQYIEKTGADKTDTEKHEHTVVYLISQYARFLAESDQHQHATEFLQESQKQYPDNTALCLQLAELAQVQGQFITAVRLLNKALKKEPENIALWVQMANASLHRFDKKARQAAEKAVELAANLQEDEKHPLAVINMQRAQAKNVLAQVESQEQNFDKSEQLFKEILQEHEYFVPALQGLGQQYMQQGKIDEALTLFERIKEVDPIKGYSSLINARQYPDDDAILEKIEKAAQKPTLEGSVRAGILFQLAATWGKRQDYDKAFEFARQANVASKKFLPYDAKKHRNQCARLRMSFCKELYQYRALCGVDSTLPVYVLGMPRSGTTLVEQIIAGHSDIFGAGELGVIPQVAQGLNRWERHVGSGRTYPDCIDDLTPFITEGIANNVLKELQEYAPAAKHIVDKLPHNFENIGLIKLLFPKAKIISVRRDPRDIAISNYFTDYQAKHGGMGFAYDLADIGEQLADHNLLMYHWHQVFPGEILELNYEDIVDDLEGSARKMLDYIGVEWQPEVLKFNELERTVKTASVWQVRQPIYKTSKDKWKRYAHYLQPLIQSTNAKIQADVIEMITLPEPGFLQTGVELYKQQDLDGAELNFKKMLHHNPEHAACNYMLGLVFFSKGYMSEGIELVEKALKKCPWQKEWRESLIKAYEQIGDDEKAVEWQNKKRLNHVMLNDGYDENQQIADDDIWLAEETDTA